MNVNKWNDLAHDFNNSKIYHTYEWGVLLSETCRHTIFYLQENDGIFPIALIKSHIFGNRLISLPFADYGGPCAQNQETTKSLILKTQELAQILKVDYIEIRHPDESSFKLFEEENFIRRDEYFTFIINLTIKLSELWKNIGDKNRNMVRKAEKNNIQVLTASSKNDLKTFYGIYLETMKNLGSPPQPFTFFSKMWDLFYPEHLVLPMAIYDGECIACGICFTYKKIIHHAYSCMLRDYSNLGGNVLIQWWIIKYGHDHSYTIMDFGRTRENAGNFRFKKHWHGQMIKMPYFYKFVNGKLDERQEIKYKSISNLWRRYMPKFLAQRIGPWLIRQIG
ncbi:MAG: GNAT family N-acetyltransferase [Candidatus Helarchaeota archaeon]|nr:GNAT family N-acetyltransferase [Candidatus Helarchaeota archaeon]